MTNTSASVRPIRWGILATGKIAATFATDLALVEGAELAAVGSRSIETAQKFADAHSSNAHSGAARAYGSYAELAADPDIDVIYVATPHGRHVEDVMTCFEAGKAVLCEKALTLDSEDAATLIEEARHRRLFFAEAMWMRCNPNIRKIQDMAVAGACGTIGQIRAELGFVGDSDSARLWDPALGASSLLDVGIYPLTFANLILGEPTHIAAAGILSDRGIDTSGGATLTYTSGAVASIAWTQMAWSDNRAAVSGDGGRIEIPSRFHETAGFSYARNSELDEFAEPVLGRGYAHEIIEVNDCLRSGLTESTLLPLDGTLAIMKQMDEIRRQIG
ncbi:MAG: Gfo/Idh/MocA family oxidoreductase [Kineosporiaceae bacterium]|nr:Gfo/Idh/MocA family oxidoreductase [Aeromicrobium sp.]